MGSTADYALLWGCLEERTGAGYRWFHRSVASAATSPTGHKTDSSMLHAKRVINPQLAGRANLAKREGSPVRRKSGAGRPGWVESFEMPVEP